MQKLSFFLITTLSAILLYTGLGSFVSVSSDLEEQSATVRPNYDGYSEGINTVMYDSEGAIAYTLQAERQYHFQDQTSDLDSPYIRLFQEGGLHWNIIAESGKIAPGDGSESAGIGIIELTGDVEVFRLDNFGNRTVINTDFLEIDPDQETMKTDQLVTMTTTNIEQKGEGLFANLAEDELLFHQNNQGSYEDSTAY